MKKNEFNKTPFLRLIIAGGLGLGTSVAPLVLLMFGLIQFKIISIVGPERVTEVFGKASGIASMAIIILGPLGGIIADKTNLKFGRRRIWMILGSIGGAVSMYFLIKSDTINILITSWILAQFFYGMVSLSCYSIVPEQVEMTKFGKVSGIFGAAAPAFIMLGGMVMGVFAKATVSQKLGVITIVQLISGIIAALLVNDGYVEIIKKEKQRLNGIKNFYPSFKKYPEYTWALLTKLFVNMSNAGMTMLTLFYIARFHLGESEIFKLNGLTSMGIGVMISAGLVGGFLSDKIKKQKPFVMGAALITGLCLVAFAFSKNISWIIGGNFIFNFGFGLYGAVDNALVNRILPSKETISKDLSIMNVTTNISSSLTNFIAPMIIAFGSKLLKDDGYTFFFLCMASFSILSALAVIPIPEIEEEKSMDVETSTL